MTKEQILNALNRCEPYTIPECCVGCPYDECWDTKGECITQLHADTYTLLKVQESKPPIWKERIVPVFEEYEDGTGAVKSHNWSDWFCPTCGGLVGERYWIPGRKPHDQQRCNYCPKCGQAIDWDSIKQE